MQRLATLTHELGHHISEEKGRPEEYKLAIAGDKPRTDWCTAPIEQRRAVLAEEVKAWCFGLELACAHGLVDKVAFIKIARAQLENYRSRVALPEDEFNRALDDVGVQGSKNDT